MGKYFEVNISNISRNTRSSIQMEAGVSFENKNYRYTMNSNGKLSIFDKNTQKTSEGTEIKLTDYQFRTMQAVMNNNDEIDDKDVLSADDIQSAINDSKSSKLGKDLGEFLINGYKVQNPKAFEDENKFSAYISNGKDTQSSVLAFQFNKEYHDVTIKNTTTGKTFAIKMEKGVSFENNGAIYRMNNDGLLAKFDKDKLQWVAEGSTINMTNYQFNAFKAVANNVNESTADSLILSKGDILDAINLYKNKKLNNDLSEFLAASGYEAKNTAAFSKRDAFSTYITNGKKNTSAVLLFKYGSAADAVSLSDYVHNDVLDNDVKIIKDRGNKKNGSDISNLSPGVTSRNIIKKYEGYRSKAYKCPAGVWTIGWGHTKNVKKGQTITKGQAEKYLTADMKEAVNAVKKNVKVKLTQNQFDALVSFTFNVGAANFKNSTLLKCINANDFTAASAQFSRWIYADNKKQPGLINRRAEERKLFDT